MQELLGLSEQSGGPSVPCRVWAWAGEEASEANALVKQRQLGDLDLHLFLSLSLEDYSRAELSSIRAAFTHGRRKGQTEWRDPSVILGLQGGLNRLLPMGWQRSPAEHYSRSRWTHPGLAAGRAIVYFFHTNQPALCWCGACILLGKIGRNWVNNFLRAMRSGSGRYSKENKGGQEVRERC